MKKYLLGLISGMLVMIVVGVSAAILYDASEIEYTPKDIMWNVDNVKDAVNDLKDNYMANSVVEKNYVLKEEMIGKRWEYDYSGNSQKFVIPVSGTYEIEIWGAQGGTSTYNGSTGAAGGNGGYSYGLVDLSKNDIIYVTVGGKGANGVKGKNSQGGYNGGGIGSWDGSDDETSGGGGGATHVAYISGTLAQIGVNNIDKVLLVAGGGGGSSYVYAAGSGGGFKGGVNSTTSQSSGTQTTGYAFGQGQDGSGAADSDGVGGGGGGLFGGYSNNVGKKSSGSGGSGYIGNSKISNGVMYCTNCTASNEENTKTIATTNVSSSPIRNYAKQGNGYAKITLISVK